MEKINYNRIKSVLVERSIPNRELAGKMGVSIQTVSRWRNNSTQPSLETLFEIAAYLQIDVRLLLVSTESFNPAYSRQSSEEVNNIRMAS